MKLIVGLGNPEEKYKGTRHNLGFEVVEEYAKKNLPSDSDLQWQTEDKFKAEIIKISQDLWLIKPVTYMNNSGLSVSAIVNYFKIPLDNLIVVHDELDISLGKIKVRVGGSAAGHHGIESIINALGDEKFIRVRLGIGSWKEHGDATQYVVESFKSDEKPKVRHMLKQAVSALDLIIEEGLEKAQNQFN